MNQENTFRARHKELQESTYWQSAANIGIAYTSNAVAVKFFADSDTMNWKRAAVWAGALTVVDLALDVFDWWYMPTFTMLVCASIPKVFGTWPRAVAVLQVAAPPLVLVPLLMGQDARGYNVDGVMPSTKTRMWQLGVASAVGAAAGLRYGLPASRVPLAAGAAVSLAVLANREGMFAQLMAADLLDGWYTAFLRNDEHRLAVRKRLLFPAANIYRWLGAQPDTAIVYALMGRGDPEAVAELVARGDLARVAANADAVEGTFSGLHVCVYLGVCHGAIDYDMLCAIDEQFDEVGVARKGRWDLDGRSLLHAAFKAGQERMVRYLLDAGECSANARYMGDGGELLSPVMHAMLDSVEGATESQVTTSMLDAMLEHGWSDFTDHKGSSVLHYMVVASRPDLARHLFEHSMEAQRQCIALHALSFATARAPDSCLCAFVNLLLSCGADASNETIDSLPVLTTLAARCVTGEEPHLIECCELLLRHGARVNVSHTERGEAIRLPYEMCPPGSTMYSMLLNAYEKLGTKTKPARR